MLPWQRPEALGIKTNDIFDGPRKSEEAKNQNLAFLLGKARVQTIKLSRSPSVMSSAP